MASEPTTSNQADAAASYKPFIPAEVVLPEFTPRAVLLGAFLGIIFGAVPVYLALRAGPTVRASVPVAVISITAFK